MSTNYSYSSSSLITTYSFTALSFPFYMRESLPLSVVENDMYTFAFTGLLKHRLKKKYKNYEEYANKYISGISNIESLKPIKAMIKLAYNKDKLPSSEFEKQFDDYIKIYGDRNLEELKLESPTFRTNPDILWAKIDEYTSDSKKLENMYNELFQKNQDTADYEREDFITRFIIKRCMIGISGREISRLNRSSQIEEE